MTAAIQPFNPALPPATPLRVIDGGRAPAPAVGLPVVAPAIGGAGGGAAAALGGAIAGPLAVLGAFALGFEAGKLLLAAWELLNRTGGETPVEIDPTDTSTWPTPNPATGLKLVITYRSEGYFDPVVRDRQSFTATTGIPFLYGVVPNGFYQGFSLAYLDQGNGQQTGPVGYPGTFRLDAVINPGGGPIPQATRPGAPGPDRAGPSDLLRRAGERLGLPSAQPVSFLPVPAPAVPAPARRPDEDRPRRVVPPVTPIRPARSPSRAAPIPNVGPQPRPQEVPGPDPSRSPERSPFPLRDPLRPPVPIGPDGRPVSPPRPEVPVTPADRITYDRVTVGDPSARPRPDLDSLARELGRQEQKLGALLGGLGYPEAFDRLLELLTSINPGGSYSIRPPCGTDSQGGALQPIEVPIAPTIGDANAIIARLDAIAELIDHHKQLRQPVCRGKTSGEPVTVTFIEVE